MTLLLLLVVFTAAIRFAEKYNQVGIYLVKVNHKKEKKSKEIR